MKRVVRLNEGDIARIVNKVISEQEDSRPLLKKIMAKLKGISDEQIRYNLKNDLPWDWTGSKEGYYEKMEPRKRHSGSN
jgi:hypothetical protein